MTRDRQPAVYIMASARNGTLHVGVTSDRARRVSEHRGGTIPGFSTRYGCKRLVFVEIHTHMAAAVLREKQIKAGSRARKLALIEHGNPTWRDLYPELV